MGEVDVDCEVWFGREWQPARITERSWNGEVRAIVPAAGTTREMRFRAAEVRTFESNT